MGGGDGEDAERLVCVGEQRRLAERRRAADQHLHSGPLGDRGDPRRCATVEREVVLPGDAAAADRGEAEGLVEQRRERRPVVLVGQPAGGPEGAKPLDLDPLSGVVLPYEAAAGEADALVGRQERSRGPPLAVVIEGEDELGHARWGERAASRDLGEVGEHRSELGPPRAAQSLVGAAGGDPGRAVGGRGRARSARRCPRAPRAPAGTSGPPSPPGRRAAGSGSRECSQRQAQRAAPRVRRSAQASVVCTSPGPPAPGGNRPPRRWPRKATRRPRRSPPLRAAAQPHASLNRDASFRSRIVARGPPCGVLALAALVAALVAACGGSRAQAGGGAQGDAGDARRADR